MNQILSVESPKKEKMNNTKKPDKNKIKRMNIEEQKNENPVPKEIRKK